MLHWLHSALPPSPVKWHMGSVSLWKEEAGRNTNVKQIQWDCDFAHIINLKKWVKWNKMCRGITVCCTGNYIIRCYLTCQICSVYNVSLSENLVNKTVMPQKQGSVAAFPVTTQRGIRRSSLWPIPGDQLLGGNSQGLGRLLSNGTQSRP